MSTKIYNACKYEGDLVSLLSELKKLRTSYLEEVKPKISKLAKEMKKTHQTPDDKFQIARDIMKLIKEAGESLEKSFIDVSSDVVIYPIHNHLFLVQFFGATITPPSIFEDFHYQNSSDQPSNVSDGEWDYRKAKWDEVFKDDSIPANAGLSFQIFGENQHFKIFHYLINLADS